MGNIIEITGLKKTYGELIAVDNISFNVEEGSLFAFLGVNGAGKSTTINIICTLLQKDAGTILVGGHNIDYDAAAIRSEIGIVFQGSILDKELNVKDNLRTRAAYYGIYGKAWESRLNELTEILELKEILNRPYGKLSGGQRRRVDIARGLIHSPKILILDEPTTGLDPQTRKTVWQIIEELRKSNGMTVFLTTHYMEEANQADKVTIIDAGKIVAEGSPVELKNQYSGNYIKFYTERNGEFEAKLPVDKCTYAGNCYVIKVEDGEEAKKIIIEYQNMIQDFEVIKGDMDDAFLNVTGKTLVGGMQK